MPPFHILLTSRCVYGFHSEFKEHSFLIETSGANLGSTLESLLPNLEKIKTNSLSIILDSYFIKHQHISLPYIKSRKVNKMIEYELEDTLIYSGHEYHYAFSMSAERAQKKTDITAFAIPVETINTLLLFCKKNNFELKRVSPLENLLDIRFQKSLSANNEICIIVEIPFCIGRLFQYKDGRLVSIATVTLPAGEETEEPESCHHRLADQINKKIKSIILHDRELHLTRLDAPLSAYFSIDDSQNLVPKSQDDPVQEWQPNSLPFYLKEITSPAIFSHPQKINLLKRDQFILQEIKKNLRGFIVGTSILILIAAVYLASLGINTVYERKKSAELDRMLENAITTYSTREANVTSSIQILKEKVNRLKAQRDQQKKYDFRTYRVSASLAGISSIKNDIPSFSLNRFSINEQSIRFQGSVDSITDFDRLRDILKNRYPKESYAITFNQNNRGSDNVAFSINIQKLTTD